MNFIPANAQHIGARAEQQDAFGFSDPDDRSFVAHGGILAVLADGIGGMASGSRASKTAVERFLSSFMAKPSEEPIQRALLRALQEANQAVSGIGGSDAGRAEVGTTLVAAVVSGASLYWISIGDSRLYLLREGRATQLTVDHVYANDLAFQVANGRISRTEALEHPERDHLTSYLGKPELTLIDRSVRPFPLEPGDVLILCSDGLYKVMPDRELADAVGVDPDKIADRLVAQTLAANSPGQDNVTVLALTCEGDEIKMPTTVAPGRVRPLVLWLGVIVVLFVCFAVAWWMRGSARQKAPGGNHVETAAPEVPAPRASPEPATMPKNDGPGQTTRRKRGGEDAKRGQAGPDHSGG